MSKYIVYEDGLVVSHDGIEPVIFDSINSALQESLYDSDLPAKAYLDNRCIAVHEGIYGNDYLNKCVISDNFTSIVLKRL